MNKGLLPWLISAIHYPQLIFQSPPKLSLNSSSSSSLLFHPQFILHNLHSASLLPWKLFYQSPQWPFIINSVCTVYILFAPLGSTTISPPICSTPEADLYGLLHRPPCFWVGQWRVYEREWGQESRHCQGNSPPASPCKAPQTKSRAPSSCPFRLSNSHGLTGLLPPVRDTVTWSFPYTLVNNLFIKHSSN